MSANGTERTCRFALQMSANDPQRTFFVRIDTRNTKS